MIENAINIFLVIADIGMSIHIFYEINDHNPYKYRRVSINLALAGCFAIMLAANATLVLSACMVAIILIFIQQFYDMKDSNYSIKRMIIKRNNKIKKL